MALAASGAAADVPVVPGACSAPPAAHRGEPGCYLSAELTLHDPAPVLYWHLFTYPDPEAARAEADRHRWATVVMAHGLNWLYVMDPSSELVVTLKDGARKEGTVGPLRHPPGTLVTARFLESTFTPGMHTRVHSHPGPEAFFVIEGIQCVETPTQHATVTAGTGFIVDQGPHRQASRDGRKSVVVVLVPPGSSWQSLEDGWTPPGYCS